MLRRERHHPGVDRSWRRRARRGRLARGRRVLAAPGDPTGRGSTGRLGRRGPPLGWAQMGRRLRCSTDWDPERTIAFSSLADIQLIELAGPDVFEGLRGALPDGGTWRIGGGLLIRYPPQDAHRRPEGRTLAP